MSKTVKKVVRKRGYVLLNEKMKPVDWLYDTHEMALRYWEHEFEDLGYSIVPATITYSITKKK